MSVAERREARRRRILDNLDGRLQRITGTTNNIEESTPFRDDNAQNLSYSSSVNENTDSQDLLDFDVAPPLLSTAYSNELNGDNASNSTKKEYSSIEYFITYFEIYLIILAILSFFLLKFNMGGIIFESTMVPFYTLEFMHVMARQGEEKSPIASLLITVLQMYGVTGPAVSSTVRVVTLGLSLAKDFCLYLFIFILTSHIFKPQ